MNCVHKNPPLCMSGGCAVDCLCKGNTVHFRIWLDVDDRAAVECVDPFHAEDVVLACDEFGDAEGEGIRAAGRAAGEYAVNLPCGGRDGLEDIPFRQMRPVEDDEVFVLLDFEQSVREVRMNRNLRDLLTHASLPWDVCKAFVVIMNDADFLKLHDASLLRKRIKIELHRCSPISVLRIGRVTFLHLLLRSFDHPVTAARSVLCFSFLGYSIKHFVYFVKCFRVPF